MPALQPLPVSAPQEYRSYPYGNTPVAGMPYTQANNASTLSLPTSFAPSDQGTAAVHEQQAPQTLDSLRSKFSAPSYNYTNYIQQ